MSTDKIREEFSAWWHADDQAELRKSCAQGWAQYVWRASRGAAMVELPDIGAWDNDGRLDRERDEEADCAMGMIPRIDVRAAIEAAGITVK